MRPSRMNGNGAVRPNPRVFRNYTLACLVFCLAFTGVFYLLSRNVYLTIVQLPALLAVLFICSFQNVLSRRETFISFTRDLLEAGLDPMFTIDREGRIIDANRITEEISGAPPWSLAGCEFKDYFTEPGKVDELCRHAMTNGPVRNCPLTFLHLRKEPLDLLLNAAAYEDKKLGLVRIVVTARERQVRIMTVG